MVRKEKGRDCRSPVLAQCTDPDLQISLPGSATADQSATGSDDNEAAQQVELKSTSDTGNAEIRATDSARSDRRSTRNVVSKHEKGWRRIVRNFSPSWFSVTMGTGIVSTILITIPWKAAWLYYLSIVFFVLNVGLFSDDRRSYEQLVSRHDTNGLCHHRGNVDFCVRTRMGPMGRMGGMGHVDAGQHRGRERHDQSGDLTVGRLARLTVRLEIRG
nr:sulfite efflux pump ssu1 [Quercus suber]